MNRFHTTCCTFFLMAFVMPGLAVAQQEGKTIARIVFYQETQEEKQGLEDALQALRQETQQLQATLKSSESQPTVAAPVKPDRWPTQRPVAQLPPPQLRSTPELTMPTPDLDSNSAGGIGGTEDIEERIQLLERIFERNRIERQKKLAEAAKANAKRTPTEMKQTPVGLQIQLPPVSPPQQDSQPPPPAVADRVFPNPVDLFEMGNSLYQTGELKTALEAYTQVDRNTITATDTVWLDFMTASCQRRLGNWEEAKVLYRQVANQRVAGNLAKPAKSWLKQLELVSQSNTSYTQMETEINSLIESVNKHVKQ